MEVRSQVIDRTAHTTTPCGQRGILRGGPALGRKKSNLARTFAAGTRPTTTRLFTVVWLLGLTAALPGCDTSAGRHGSKRVRPNVILICIDTLRADRLGCYGYSRHATSPHLDALAGQSTVFLDASATAGWTKPSVPSFLTGTYPAQHGVYEGNVPRSEGTFADVLPDKALTLAEVFRQDGYRTGAVVQNEHLRRGNGIEQGFEFYADRAGDAHAIRWRALDWLDESADDRPFFLYLHILDTHYPYAVPDADARRFLGDTDASLFRSAEWRKVRKAVNHGDRVLTASELEALEFLYDGAIRYVDDQIGRLFRSLMRRGLYDDSVICVVADHGEEFMEHGRIGHGHGLFENLLHVPWILRIPGRAAERNTARVSLVDLFPTLLSAAGIESSAVTEGIDRVLDPHRDRPILAEHKERSAYMQSYRSGSIKVVRRFVPTDVASGVHALADFLEMGSGCEAALADSPGRNLHIASLKPRDADASGLTEIKAFARDVSASGLTVVGITVRLSRATKFHGAVEKGADRASFLYDGVPVKVVGRFEGTTLIADRVKIYPADKKVKPLIRGNIAGREGDTTGGRLRVGGVWLAVDKETRCHPDDFNAGAGRMDREEIARAIGPRSEPSSRAAFRMEVVFFDLASDPQEQDPQSEAPGSVELISELDVEARRALGRRIYVGSDRTRLPPDAVERLRAIGYIE